MKNETFNLNGGVAENELPIKSCELLEEIIPLLKDYFIGQISLDEEGIVYAIPNGQKFKITASETV